MADKEIHKVCKNGNVERLKSLISKGENINIRGEDKFTPLICAARYGKEKCVRVLLEAKARLNLQTTYGDSALIWAAENGHTDIVKALLEGRADANLQNTYGRSAMIRAARNGHTDIVKALLEGRADTKLQTKEGKTALSYAKKAEIKNLIESAQAKEAKAREAGWLLIHESCYDMNFDSLKEQIRKGIGLNSKTLKKYEDVDANTTAFEIAMEKKMFSDKKEFLYFVILTRMYDEISASFTLNDDHFKYISSNFESISNNEDFIKISFECVKYKNNSLKGLVCEMKGIEVVNDVILEFFELKSCNWFQEMKLVNGELKSVSVNDLLKVLLSRIYDEKSSIFTLSDSDRVFLNQSFGFQYNVEEFARISFKYIEKEKIELKGFEMKDLDLSKDAISAGLIVDFMNSKACYGLKILKLIRLKLDSDTVDKLLNINDENIRLKEFEIRDTDIFRNNSSKRRVFGFLNSKISEGLQYIGLLNVNLKSKSAENLFNILMTGKYDDLNVVDLSQNKEIREVKKDSLEGLLKKCSKQKSANPFFFTLKMKDCGFRKFPIQEIVLNRSVDLDRLRLEIISTDLQIPPPSQCKDANTLGRYLWLLLQDNVPSSLVPIVIVGPKGVGKTTILKCGIAGEPESLFSIEIREWNKEDFKRWMKMIDMPLHARACMDSLLDGIPSCGAALLDDEQFTGLSKKLKKKLLETSHFSKEHAKYCLRKLSEFRNILIRLYNRIKFNKKEMKHMYVSTIHADDYENIMMMVTQKEISESHNSDNALEEGDSTASSLPISSLKLIESDKDPLRLTKGESKQCTHCHKTKGFISFLKFKFCQICGENICESCAKKLRMKMKVRFNEGTKDMKEEILEKCVCNECKDLYTLKLKVIDFNGEEESFLVNLAFLRSSRALFLTCSSLTSNPFLVGKDDDQFDGDASNRKEDSFIENQNVLNDVIFWRNVSKNTSGIESTEVFNKQNFIVLTYFDAYLKYVKHIDGNNKNDDISDSETNLNYYNGNEAEAEKWSIKEKVIERLDSEHKLERKSEGFRVSEDDTADLRENKKGTADGVTADSIYPVVSGDSKNHELQRLRRNLELEAIRISGDSNNYIPRCYYYALHEIRKRYHKDLFDEVSSKGRTMGGMCIPILSEEKLKNDIKEILQTKYEYILKKEGFENVNEDIYMYLIDILEIAPSAYASGSGSSSNDCLLFPLKWWPRLTSFLSDSDKLASIKYTGGAVLDGVYLASDLKAKIRMKWREYVGFNSLGDDDFVKLLNYLKASNMCFEVKETSLIENREMMITMTSPSEEEEERKNEMDLEEKEQFVVIPSSLKSATKNEILRLWTLNIGIELEMENYSEREFVILGRRLRGNAKFGVGGIPKALFSTIITKLCLLRYERDMHSDNQRNKGAIGVFNTIIRKNVLALSFEGLHLLLKYDDTEKFLEIWMRARSNSPSNNKKNKYEKKDEDEDELKGIRGEEGLGFDWMSKSFESVRKMVLSHLTEAKLSYNEYMLCPRCLAHTLSSLANNNNNALSKEKPPHDPLFNCSECLIGAAPTDDGFEFESHLCASSNSPVTDDEFRDGYFWRPNKEECLRISQMFSRMNKELNKNMRKAQRGHEEILMELRHLPNITPSDLGVLESYHYDLRSGLLSFYYVGKSIGPNVFKLKNDFIDGVLEKFSQVQGVGYLFNLYRFKRNTVLSEEFKEFGSFAADIQSMEEIAKLTADILTEIRKEELGKVVSGEGLLQRLSAEAIDQVLRLENTHQYRQKKLMGEDVKKAKRQAAADLLVIKEAIKKGLQSEEGVLGPNDLKKKENSFKVIKCFIYAVFRFNDGARQITAQRLKKAAELKKAAKQNDGVSEEKMEQFEGQLEHLERKFEELKTSQSNSKKEINELRSENANSKKEINELRSENEKLNIKLETSQSNSKKEIKELRSENANSKKEINELRSENANSKKEINELRSVNEKLNIKLETSQSNSKQEINELRSENANSKKEINELRSENANSKKEINELRSENAKLNAKIEAIEQMIYNNMKSVGLDGKE